MSCGQTVDSQIFWPKSVKLKPTLFVLAHKSNSISIARKEPHMIELVH